MAPRIVVDESEDNPEPPPASFPLTYYLPCLPATPDDDSPSPHMPLPPTPQPRSSFSGARRFLPPPSASSTGAGGEDEEPVGRRWSLSAQLRAFSRPSFSESDAATRPEQSPPLGLESTIHESPRHGRTSSSQSGGQSRRASWHPATLIAEVSSKRRAKEVLPEPPQEPLRAMLHPSTHADGFYRSGEPVAGSVTIPRIDKCGREVMSVKARLHGVLDLHLLQYVEVGSISSEVRTKPYPWQSYFLHQDECLLTRSDVRAAPATITLPFTFILPAATTTVGAPVPLPPTLQVEQSEELQDPKRKKKKRRSGPAFSAAAVTKEPPLPGARVVYSVEIVVKRLSARHALRGLLPSKKEVATLEFPVRPHAPIRQTVAVPSVATAANPCHSRRSLTVDRLSDGSMSLSTALRSSVTEAAADETPVSPGRQAAHGTSGISLMPTSRGLQGWQAYRLTSQIDSGNGNFEPVEAELSWPAQLSLAVSDWVPFKLSVRLPPHAVLSRTQYAEAVQLTLLRNVQTTSTAGTLVLQKDVRVPLEVVMDVPARDAAPPASEYGSLVLLSGQMRVCDGTRAEDRASGPPLPSFTFRRLTVDYRLLLAITLRAIPASLSSVGHLHVLHLDAPVHVACDAAVIAATHERRERRRSARTSMMRTEERRASVMPDRSDDGSEVRASRAQRRSDEEADSRSVAEHRAAAEARLEGARRSAEPRLSPSTITSAIGESPRRSDTSHLDSGLRRSGASRVPVPYDEDVSPHNLPSIDTAVATTASPAASASERLRAPSPRGSPIMPTSYSLLQEIERNLGSLAEEPQQLQSSPMQTPPLQSSQLQAPPLSVRLLPGTSSPSQSLRSNPSRANSRPPPLHRLRHALSGDSFRSTDTTGTLLPSYFASRA